jgi:hypothetical protein
MAGGAASKTFFVYEQGVFCIPSRLFLCHSRLFLCFSVCRNSLSELGKVTLSKIRKVLKVFKRLLMRLAACLGGSGGGLYFGPRR